MKTEVPLSLYTKLLINLLSEDTLQPLSKRCIQTQERIILVKSATIFTKE